MMPMGQYNKGKYVSHLLKQIRFLDNEDNLEEEINTILGYTIGGNPRSLKRLVNSLALINIFSKMDGDADKKKKVTEVMTKKTYFYLVWCVCRYHSQIYMTYYLLTLNF